MRRLVPCAALAFVAVLAGACHSGQVRLLATRGSTSHQWRNAISAEQFSAPVRKLFYTVAPPMGYAEARLHPLEGQVLTARVRWNAAIRSLLDRFDELRMQHNQALITASEFDERHRRLLAVAADLAGKKTQLDAALEQYSAAKDALDAALLRDEQEQPQNAAAARAKMDEAAAAANAIVGEAEQLVDALRAP